MLDIAKHNLTPQCRESIAALQSDLADAAAQAKQLAQQNEELQDQLGKAEKHADDLTAMHEQAQETGEARMQALSDQCIVNMKQMKVG